MMAGRLVEEPDAVIDGSCLGIFGAVVEAPDAGLGDRSCAHGAWLQGNVEVGTVEAMAPGCLACLAQGKDLGMGRGIGEFADAVAGCGDDLSLQHDNGTDRWFVAQAGGRCLLEGDFHESQGSLHEPDLARSGPNRHSEIASCQSDAMPSRRPLIGLTLDSEEPGPYSNMPWYAIRQNYMSSVVDAGGLPVAISHETDLAEAYLEELDGVVVTGGAFDIDPALFGAGTRHETVKTKDRRTRFEWDVTEGALRRDLPVFGICGGQQLLNVVLGGTLIQHIPDAVPDCLQHEQPGPRTRAGHTVKVTGNTVLHDIVRVDTLPVNSAHHQAADGTGDGVKINAVAPDGVIEGIEHPGFRFCLGVQWHPEYGISEGDGRLFRAFLEACQR